MNNSRRINSLPDELPLGVGEFLGHTHLVGVEVVNVAQLGFGSRSLRRT